MFPTVGVWFNYEALINYGFEGDCQHYTHLNNQMKTKQQNTCLKSSQVVKYGIA